MTIDDPSIFDELPLTEQTLYILLSLARQPRHGYAILQDVEALSQCRVALSTSTLYTALKRLLVGGWIVRDEAPDDEREDGGPGLPRKYYALTERGRSLLGAELARMDGVLASARRRLAEEGA